MRVALAFAALASFSCTLSFRRSFLGAKPKLTSRGLFAPKSASASSLRSTTKGFTRLSIAA